MKKSRDEIDLFEETFKLSDIPLENWEKLFEYKPELQKIYEDYGLRPDTSTLDTLNKRLNRLPCRDINPVGHDDFSKFDGRAWSILLSAHPEFADQCDWKKLDDTCWFYLLYWQPQFADKCDLNEICGGELLFLLPAHPQFAHKINEKTISEIDAFAIFQGIAQLPGGGIAPITHEYVLLGCGIGISIIILVIVMIMQLSQNLGQLFVD